MSTLSAELVKLRYAQSLSTAQYDFSSRVRCNSRSRDIVTITELPQATEAGLPGIQVP